ncbi:MAG: 50S ribosomal protein L4 [Victivallaceae bacterium]|nr:50S ribosomal protein L4 [Victivallaceae bacterium]
MSKTLDIFDCTGARVGEYALPDNAIELEKGTQAVHDAVVAYLAGQRAGTACTKTRAEVSGGGAKPFRQKGRGAARAGSSRNPVWTGGGVAFGPKPRSFAKKLNKKVLVLALKRALSERIEEGNVIVLDKFALADHKTKSAVAVLKALKVADESVLLSVPELDEATVCATGNIANLVLRTALTVNTYELMRFNKLVFTKDALDAFIGRLA